MAEVIHVLWETPAAEIPEEDAILSFLSPQAERNYIARFGARVVPGREFARKVRGQAVAHYLKVSADVGVAKSRGSTFRQALQPSGECSHWWFHPVSFKDCEQHPILERIITLFTLVAVATENGCSRLKLYGAPAQLADVLKQRFEVTSVGAPLKAVSDLSLIIKGLLSRLGYLFSTWRMARLARRSIPDPGTFDLLLTGFWMGSVAQGEDGRLSDRYFKRLPDELEKRNVRVGWLVALEPGRERAENEGVGKDRRMVALPQFLGFLDLLRRVVSIRALTVYLGWRGRAGFQAAFAWEGMNLLPLFRETLTHHFAGRAIPQCRTTVLATERACRSIRPSVTLCYLEHHLFARSHYEGVRRSGEPIRCFAMQHASVGNEKTFYHFDAETELAGRPDGQPVPRPEHVFAMGDLGRRLFLKWGYGPDQVVTTGVARFDNVKFAATNGEQPVASRTRGSLRRILMVPSLADEIEIDLVEAVCCAAEGLSGLELCLRKHPFSRLDTHPRFQAFADRLEMTRGDLNADIDQADLVLFTYSTVADEAFLAGKPCWQWLPLGFNGSALTDVVELPQFGTVEELRNALASFVEQPEKFVPSLAVRRKAAGDLFGPADGGAAKRIAEALREAIPAGSGNSTEVFSVDADAIVP